MLIMPPDFQIIAVLAYITIFFFTFRAFEFIHWTYLKLGEELYCKKFLKGVTMSVGCFEVLILKRIKVPAFTIIVLCAICNNALTFSMHDLEVQRQQRERESERERENVYFPYLYRYTA